MENLWERMDSMVSLQVRRVCSAWLGRKEAAVDGAAARLLLHCAARRPRLLRHAAVCGTHGWC